MNKLSKAGKLWLVLISMSASGILGWTCHCKKKTADKPSVVKEYPKPATDAQTDSLKKVLDEERSKRLNERKP